MNPTLRRLVTSDLPFADSLRVSAGWNQTMQDWHRFLAMEPDGCFLAEWDGCPAGLVTTHIHGPEVAWIGMALVHPDYRRRGIGRALLDHAIQYLRSRRVACIKLDATPLGQKVYETMGFQAEWTLSRWTRTGFATSAIDPCLHPWQATDQTEISRLDLKAFGVSRERLIQVLATQSERALVLQSEASNVSGYGLLRAGSLAHYLGPVVATSATDAKILVQELAKTDGQIFWDIPDQNSEIIAWAQSLGLQKARSLTRMFLGQNTQPGKPKMQFAIAAPEVG